MGVNVPLILNNILLIFSGVLALGVALFTYLNGRKKEANIVFAFLLLSAVVFLISHAVGINITDPELSRRAFMWNMCMFAAGAFQVHAILALFGKSREKRWIIIFMYVTAVLFIILFSITPELFLLPSHAKMYFPNYYVPGSLNWIRIAYLDVVAFGYSMYLFVKELAAAQTREKYRQYIYLFWSYFFAYIFIFIPNFLVYDIHIDPLWGTLWSPIFIAPFLYGALHYGMMNIKVIAKQAFFYGVAVAGIGGLITIFNYSNIWIHELMPEFPLWINAFVSAVLAVTIGVFVWKRLREEDFMKYEFISTVTHKFRTPLTHIKWASENLAKEQLTPDGRDQISYIDDANTKLTELTNVLAKASEAESTSYEYHAEPVDISVLVERMAASLAAGYASGHVQLEKHLEPQMLVRGDDSRLTFVVQTLMSNALYYSPKGGPVSVKTFRQKNNIVCVVEDKGIGISKEELPLLFTKFYRGESAKLTDTEGMGIGLFISKHIINHHKGKIWVESDGPDKGSKFTFVLPAAQKK